VKKIFSTIIIVAVALVVIALILVGVYLDRIVEKGIRSYGSQMTGTPVQVDNVHLSLLTGSANVKGLVVGNPKGYTTDHAISFGTIAVGLVPTTVFSDKTVIRSIRLESPEITFDGGLGGNNLSQISDNVNSSDKSSGTQSTNAATQPKPTKKYEVDDLVITGGKIHVMLTGMQNQQTITLPDIHLTDLGKDGDGITTSELTKRVLSAMTSKTVETVAKNAGNLNNNAAALKQIGGAAGLQISNAVKNVLNSNTVKNVLSSNSIEKVQNFFKH
jgi:hypothetical protein